MVRIVAIETESLDLDRSGVLCSSSTSISSISASETLSTNNNDVNNSDENYDNVPNEKNDEDEAMKSDLEAAVRANDLARTQELLAEWKTHVSIANTMAVTTPYLDFSLPALAPKSRIPAPDSFLTDLLELCIKQNNRHIAMYLQAEGAALDYELYGPLISYKSLYPPIEIFELLLDLAWNINCDHPIWGTPLVLACQYGRVDLIKWLLSHGANPNQQTNDFPERLRFVARQLDRLKALRYVPLDFAAARADKEIFTLLLENGADITLSSPIHAVIGTGKSSEVICDMIRFLLDLGVDINAIELENHPALRRRLSRYRSFCPPLHLAAGRDPSMLPVTNFLIAHGAVLFKTGWPRDQTARDNVLGQSEDEDFDYMRPVADYLSTLMKADQPTREVLMADSSRIVSDWEVESSRRELEM